GLSQPAARPRPRALLLAVAALVGAAPDHGRAAVVGELRPLAPPGLDLSAVRDRAAADRAALHDGGPGAARYARARPGRSARPFLPRAARLLRHLHLHAGGQRR